MGGGVTPSTNPILTLYGYWDNDMLGTAVAGVGDVTGDGWPDAAAGPYAVMGPPPLDGYVFILLGGPTWGTVWTLTANRFLPQCDYPWGFGQTLAGIGDVNGDGIGDLLVGNPIDSQFTTTHGRVYLFFGGSTLDGRGCKDADLSFWGSLASSSRFGQSMAGGE